jgi:transcriptional regulator with XRE-family HTH domain
MRRKADLGEAVVFIAEKADLSQKTLAQALELKAGTVSDWKRKGRNPNPKALRRLPEVLGCTMSEIEEVAAYFSKWRDRMKSRKIQAGDVADASLGPQLSLEDMEHEASRTFISLVRQLRSMLTYPATSGANNFPINLPEVPADRGTTSRRNKPTS